MGLACSGGELPLNLSGFAHLRLEYVETSLHPLFLGPLAGQAFADAQSEKPAMDPLVRVVDLRVGQAATVELCDGTKADVKLLDLDERRDSLRNAVRQAVVTVEVNGRKVELTSATYRPPCGKTSLGC